VENAFKNLCSGRIQPVALEVPMDVLGQTARIDMHALHIPRPVVEPDAAKISQAATMIRKAKFPLIYVGSGAVHAKEEIARLARLIRAPVCSFRVRLMVDSTRMLALFFLPPAPLRTLTMTGCGPGKSRPSTGAMKT
jgi:acetolactate synthase-1/2/3 large subunit